MARLAMVALLSCISYSALFLVIQAQQFSTERPFARPSQVVLGRRKHIDVSAPTNRGPANVGLDAQSRNRVLARVQNRQNLLAGAKGDAATAAFGGQSRATGRLVRGRGGTVNAGGRGRGGHRGVMINDREGDGSNVANFTLDGRHRLYTKGEGRGGTERFTAKNDRDQWGIDPERQDRRKGDGVLNVHQRGRKEYYLYEIEDMQDGRMDAVIAEPENKNQQPTGLIGQLFQQQRTKKYKCEARRVGESQCYDQNGRNVGKVNVNDKGEAIVYSKYDIPVYRGRVQRTGRTKYISVVNNGLLQADVKHIEGKDCVRDLGGTPGKYDIRLSQPLTFTYQTSRTRNGETAIRWPDCFDIGGNVRLGPGVDPERMAFEWIVNLRPVGRLRCIDPGTCKKDCYYCDACKSREHKLDILDNTESNICQAKGGNNYQMKVKICPPPEVFNWAMCSKFTKFAADDYWKKKGDLDVQLRIWMRPKNEEEKTREFHEIMDNPLTGRVRRLAFIGEYARDEGISSFNLNPTDQELLEWYIQHKGGQSDEIAVCQNAVVSWGLGGQQVDSSFLIEAAGAAGSFPDIISRTQCPKWQELQRQQYEDDKQRLAGSSSGNSGRNNGLFGNLFGNLNRFGQGG